MIFFQQCKKYSRENRTLAKRVNDVSELLKLFLLDTVFSYVCIISPEHTQHFTDENLPRTDSTPNGYDYICKYEAIKF